MKYLLGIDFGGGASKATLLNTQGEIVAENTVEYPTLHPQDGWCEQCPEHWISALNENIKALLLKSGANSEDILAVAVDSAKARCFNDGGNSIRRPGFIGYSPAWRVS